MEIKDAVSLTRLLLREHTAAAGIDPLFIGRLTTWLTDLGFSVASVASHSGVQHLRASIGPLAAQLRIAFVGHYDTVPVGSGWQRPALEAVEESGVLYGRGASDMKSGVAAMIFAARSLASRGVRSTVFLPGDEETTSAGMPALLDANPEGFDYCIGGEPTSKVVLGDCIKIGRRGVVRGQITLLGEAGHAAYAELSPNVIYKLPLVLTALEQRWNDGGSGADTTVSVTNITTDSTATNVIPARVELTIDVRFAPHRQLEEIVEEITRRLDSTLVKYTLQTTKGSKPYVTCSEGEESCPQVRLVRRAVEAVVAVTGVTPTLAWDGGTSDARFVAWRGVPTIEFGVPHGNMHGPDEFVATRDVELLVQIYERIGHALLAAT